MPKTKKKKAKKTTASVRQTTGPDFTIYTDGSCLRNPGGPGGYGAISIDASTGEVFEFSGGYRSTTNNRMELMAAIVALEHLPVGKSALLYSDSQYLVNCFSGTWEIKKNTDLFERLSQAIVGKTVEAKWLRGHSGNPYNEMCDRMAASAINQSYLRCDTGYENTRTQGERPRSSGYYMPAPGQAAAQPASAMETVIKIPQYLESVVDWDMTAEQYAKKYHVNPSCARAIQIFGIAGSKRFKDYMSLKTGGLDYWSMKSLPQILAELPKAKYAFATVKNYLENIKEITSAMRWYARGLPLDDSIRKVMVDSEIARNTMATGS